jgi:hypothetical protein
MKGARLSDGNSTKLALQGWYTGYLWGMAAGGGPE